MGFGFKVPQVETTLLVWRILTAGVSSLLLRGCGGGGGGSFGLDGTGVSLSLNDCETRRCRPSFSEAAAALNVDTVREGRQLTRSLQ